MGTGGGDVSVVIVGGGFAGVAWPLRAIVKKHRHGPSSGCASAIIDRPEAAAIDWDA